MEITRNTIESGISLAVTEIPGLVDLDDSNNFGLRHVVENVGSASRRAEIIVTGLLVKELFGSDCEPEHEPSGKPFLRNSGRPLPVADISVSHCRGAVAVAFVEKGRVGVDIEQVRDRVMRVKDRFLSSEELRFTGLSVWLTTLAWTAKEALFKCIPESGVDFAGDLALDLHSVEEGTCRCEYAAKAFGRDYRMISLFEDGRIMTLAIPAEI